MFSEYQSGTMDVSLDFYGYEDCPPNYSFGPSIRETYVLHYITQGRGKFYYKDQVIDLTAGDLFLLKPNELTFYQADSQEPWSYYWLGLSGNKIADYFRYSQIEDLAFLRRDAFKDKIRLHQLIENLVQTASQITLTSSNLQLLASIYEILFQLAQEAPSSQPTDRSSSNQLYLDAKHIIETRYSLTELTIQSIANELSINRSYLTTVFKDHQQQSPKEYLLQIRMQRAKQLIETTKESIKVVAISVGFSDALYFSKSFKKFWKMTPTTMRKRKNNSQAIYIS
ncbi:AraC family transcriptional regulator [Streptococcus thoraltensis]|uniref:AraC family transcriptional regulator n=1 Tax=Streptococcus thoraltensis TaxID=55085 RepID=UPI000374CB5E|nr:AraC family ligand binding domain-containing protein [Streptococcus thoraltensis]